MNLDPILQEIFSQIEQNFEAYSEAKGKLAQLETYKSSLKSIMMKKSGENTVGAQEREAYASKDYVQLGYDIGFATEEAERLKWILELSKMRFDAWRTMQASNRFIEKATL
jgi:hypothetical protein